jgi:hypothetical protein
MREMKTGTKMRVQEINGDRDRAQQKGRGFH